MKNLLNKIFTKKSNKINVPEDDKTLLDKAYTLIGQWCVVAFSGEFNNVKITGVSDIIHYSDGTTDVRFKTDDSFYNTILYDADTVMNWVYNCDGKEFKDYK